MRAMMLRCLFCCRFRCCRFRYYAIMLRCRRRRVYAILMPRTPRRRCLIRAMPFRFAAYLRAAAMRVRDFSPADAALRYCR